MSPEKQRIAIAEACGWRRRASTNKDFEFVWMHKDEGYCYALPDYLSDMNAMHGAEAVLRGDKDDENSERGGYIENLVVLCCENSETEIFNWDVARATAAQRAEAFLRTIGKWSDA